MARTLDVYLHRDLVGHLIQDDGGRIVFDYAEAWLQSPKARPLSHSLPLRRGRFTRKECRGYFAGVLPEVHQEKPQSGLPTCPDPFPSEDTSCTHNAQSDDSRDEVNHSVLPVMMQ